MSTINLQGKIGTLGNTQITLDGRNFSIQTEVDYTSEKHPYTGQFTFYGPLCEEIIGRSFEFKEEYNQESINSLRKVPFAQFLRVWNIAGVGCRDYIFIDKNRRK